MGLSTQYSMHVTKCTASNLVVFACLEPKSCWWVNIQSWDLWMRFLLNTSLHSAFFETLTSLPHPSCWKHPTACCCHHRVALARWGWTGDECCLVSSQYDAQNYGYKVLFWFHQIRQSFSSMCEIPLWAFFFHKLQLFLYIFKSFTEDRLVHHYSDIKFWSCLLWDLR